MIAVGDRLSLALSMLALLLIGCATRYYREDSPPPASELLTIYQTQVAIGECVFKPEPEAAALAAIATALTTSVVSQGVNHLGEAAEEAAKETNDKVTAARNIEVTANTFGPCIQILRGWFYRGFKSADENRSTFAGAINTWASPNKASAIDPERLSLLWQRRIWLAEQPDFVFEAEIIPAHLSKMPDSQLLTLAPVYARLNNPISRPWLSSSEARDVAVFLAFHEADEEPAAPGNAAGGIVVGRLDLGVDRYFPPVSSDTDNTPNRDPSESKWFRLSIGESKKPMTITALVTEHRGAQPFLQFVADVFGGAKDPISAELQNAFVPALSNKANETEKAANEAAHTAYEGALVDALSAVSACATGVTDPIRVSSEIRGKVRELNEAARVLGRNQFDENHVPLSTETTHVLNGCRKLKNKLLRVVSPTN